MTTVPTLAGRAAEAIRAAVHAFRPGQLTVPDTYTAVGDLARTAECLEQLCRQLAAGIDQRRQLGGLRHDSGGDPDTTIADARIHLTKAASAADAAARHLEHALNPLCHLADTGKQRHR